MWGRDFLPIQTGPGAHPASCTMGTGSFRGVKCGRGILLTTHPLLVQRLWKSRTIPLPTLWATQGLWRDHLTFYKYSDVKLNYHSDTDFVLLGRSWIEFRWRRDFPPVQTGPGAHPAFCKMGIGSLPGVKYGRTVLLTTHPLLESRPRKSRAIPLPTLWVTPGL